jgi:hypothetical protein
MAQVIYHNGYEEFKHMLRGGREMMRPFSPATGILKCREIHLPDLNASKLLNHLCAAPYSLAEHHSTTVEVAPVAVAYRR